MLSQSHRSEEQYRRDEFASEAPGLVYSSPAALIRRLADVLVISDTHFFHHNIVEYQSRPANADALMIQRWNERVGRDDLLLHCGDVVHGCTIEHVAQHLPRLQGKIHLLRGNHDRVGRTKYFANRNWRLVRPFEAPYREWIVRFAHRPVPVNQLPPRVLNVHGHIHGQDEPSPFHINVSVERLDYTPARLGPLLDAAIDRCTPLAHVR